MSQRMTELGVALLQHLKTAKSVPVAKRATEWHSGAMRVSTFAEAEYFLAHGFSDITYVVCIAPGKLQNASDLIAKDSALKILVDGIEAARAACGIRRPTTIQGPDRNRLRGCPNWRAA